MKRILLCLLALLTACIVLTACGHRTTDDGAAAPTPAPVEPTPEPTPELPPYEPNILTGAPRDASYVPDQRPVAVMVNNITQARPQRGLSKADILVEIKVEGGITRFMPIFQDYSAIGEVGPVRSGRDQFFQLILPWQMLYVHEGQSTPMSYFSRDNQYGSPANNYTEGYLNCNKGGVYGYRNFNRVNWAGANYNAGTLAYEHTLYMNSESIAKYIENEQVDMGRAYNSTFFNFVDYRTAAGPRDLAAGADANYVTDYGPVVSDGEYVEITHSQSYRTRFVYDAANSVYQMQQYYSGYGWRETRDEANDNVLLSFPNLVILFTDIHTYPEYREKDLQTVDFNSGGAGYYCYGGKCERIYWQKGGPIQALQLYYLTEDGKCSDIPLEMNIGRTYLAVVGLDFYNNFVHKPLSEVDVSANTSYAGTVTGPAASSYEVGEDDGGDTGAADAGQTAQNGGHHWDSGVLTQPNGACQPGIITYTCTDGDGATYTEEAAPTAEHSYDANGNCTVCTYYNAAYDTRLTGGGEAAPEQQAPEQAPETAPEQAADPAPETVPEGGE